MNKSASILNLSKALAQFQVKVDRIIKRSENPFFHSLYADLPSILNEIALPLAECDLVISQWPDGEGLTTLLIHSLSGEFLEATATMHPVKQDPQSIGSAQTYQRRYSICAILCLNVDKDDDGNAASQPEQKPTEKATLPWLNKGTAEFKRAKGFIDAATDKPAALKSLRLQYSISKEVANLLAQ